MTDAVATTLISSVCTMVTVIVTGWINRKTTRDNASKIHDKIDTMARTTTEMEAAPSVVEGDRNVVLPLRKEP